MENLKIGFMGAGNIAGALIDGILGAKLFEAGDINLFDVDAEKVKPYALRGARACQTGRELAELSDILVLAIKPQVMEAVLSSIGPFLSGKYVISVAAGITADLIKSFAPGAKVMRVMPNTPMLIGKGAIAIARPDDMSEAEIKRLSAIFECCGMVAMVEKDKMNEIIAVNGSSPAFFYRFVEVIADYAEAHGIGREQAVTLAAKSMEGAAAMILRGEKSPAQLIRDVSSPGGTTLAALASMDADGLDASFTRALEACLRRANELSK